MKTIRFLPLATLALLVVAHASAHNVLPGKGLQTVVSKQNTAFAFFRTHRQGRGVTATWAVSLPGSVAGFTVQRTYEDPTDPYAFWEDLGWVPANATRSFTYTDKEVFPGVISYRVVALQTDGTAVLSDVSQVRIPSRK